MIKVRSLLSFHTGVWLLIPVLLMPFLALAQSDRGTITGTVADPAGAVVPGAALVLRNAETGAVYESKTTDTGNYTVPSLPSGIYELTVTSAGFTKYIQRGIQVQIGTTIRIDVGLQIGAATDSVTVVEAAALLKTESAEQSFNTTTAEVNALPLSQGAAGLRNPLAFATLAPSMSVPVTNTYGNIQARVNGMPNNTFRTMVDGQDITNSIDPSHLSESHPSMEALQEVQLSSSNFAAEFGRVAGGLFNLTSRSGSNSFHGTGYEYLTNEDFGAGIPYTNSGNGHLLRPNNRNNDFGFSIGGPIILPKLYNGKNRTFFFFNLEQWRSKQVSTGFGTVPTAAYRNGDFSGALGRSLGSGMLENMIYDPLTERIVDGQSIRDPFVNNTIPTSRIDPVSAKIQALIPGATTSAAVDNFAIVDPITNVKSIPSLKVDHYFGTALKVSFYWSQWRQDQNKCCTADGLGPQLSPQRNIIDRTPTYRINIDETITPTLLVHLGGGVVHYHHVDSSPDSLVNYDAAKNLGLTGASKTPGGFPPITGLLATSQGGMSSTIGTTNAGLYHNDKPTVVLSTTWVHGNHTIKGGGEWQQDIWTSESYGSTMGNYAFSAAQTGLPYLLSTTVGGGSIGFNYASFLLGTSNTASVANFQDAQWRKHNLGFFLQDTFKLTRKLTVDFGVRWDYQTAFHEIYGRNSRFSPYLANPSAGGLPGAVEYDGFGAKRCNCNFTETYPYALGPRLGIAYQLAPKTVLRAGWGFVYGTTASVNYQLGGAVGTGFNTINFASPSFGAPATVFKTGLQYNIADLYLATLDPGIRPLAGQMAASPVYYDPSGGRPGRINQWNISLQRELSKDLVLEAAYVGNRGVWMQSDALMQFNNLTAERLASFGMDINSAADRSLLTSRMDSAQVIARGFKLPYASFPSGQPLAQALRPYPQFTTVGGRWVARGNSWYDSFQSKLTKRASHGLTASMSFTWQKELNLDAQGGMGSTMEPEPVNDINNRFQNKYISKNSQPFQLAMGFNYQMPALTPNRFIKAVVRDWTVGGVLRYASGLPIQVPAAQNNLTTLLMRGTFANRVPGQPLFLKDLNCHCIDPNKELVLNPAAWSDPAPGQWGTSAAYYNDYRYQRRPSESASMGRIFKIRESMSLQIRAEFFNVFNRTEMANPDSTNARAATVRNPLGVPTAGFGRINAQANYMAPRSGQVVARFQF